MAKKKAKSKVAAAREVIESIEAETETDRFQKRMADRFAKMGGSVQRAINWPALLSFVLQIMEACGDMSSKRVARRIAKARWRARAKMVDNYQKHMKNNISWDDAESIVNTIQADANADRKGMERLFDEAKTPMAW